MCTWQWPFFVGRLVCFTNSLRRWRHHLQAFAPFPPTHPLQLSLSPEFSLGLFRAHFVIASFSWTSFYRSRKQMSAPPYDLDRLRCRILKSASSADRCALLPPEREIAQLTNPNHVILLTVSRCLVILGSLGHPGEMMKSGWTVPPHKSSALPSVFLRRLPPPGSS